jgi:hypothetical protein
MTYCNYRMQEAKNFNKKKKIRNFEPSSPDTLGSKSAVLKT